MTPRPRPYATASIVPRRRCSGFRSARRSASVARPVGESPNPPAIEPLSPTVTGGLAASKNALPRLFVVDGPLKEYEM